MAYHDPTTDPGNYGPPASPSPKSKARADSSLGWPDALIGLSDWIQFLIANRQRPLAPATQSLAGLGSGRASGTALTQIQPPGPPSTPGPLGKYLG